MNIKNFKAGKRLLALLNAGIMTLTPVMANASSTEETKDTTRRFSFVEQKQEIREMTLEEFENGVYAAYDEASKYITYGNSEQDAEKLFHDVKKIFYLVNHSYINPELDAYLINNGYIDELDFSNPDKRTTFYEALSFINVLGDYNQRKIRKTANINDIFDVSTFYFNEAAKNHVHDIVTKWFNCHKMNEYNFEPYFIEAYEDVTTLNAIERKNNADSLNVEEEWFAKTTLGTYLMEVERDWFRDYHLNDPELTKFFDKELFNKGQYYLRKDEINEYDYSKMIDRYVYYYGVLWKYCIDDVNIEILNKFRKSSNTRQMYYETASMYDAETKGRRL